MNNSVELIDYMGSDKLHSLAAWASTFYDLELELPKDPHMRVDEIVEYIVSKSSKMRSIEDLLNYLAANEHESPFRMSSFVFGMTTDIATHIQKLKHKVVLESENAESAKYKELKEDKFYLPTDWDVPISEFFLEGVEITYIEGQTWKDILIGHSSYSNELYHEALKQLKPVLGNKRAKETARYFKTYNSQINSINKFSFAGVMTFYKKRTVDFAQDEIKYISTRMVECIKDIPGNPFEYSLKAFGL